MIGSLLFYGLYPLTRFLKHLASEPSKKGSSSALVNGTVCNGGSVSTSRFTNTQTALLDQWLSTSTGPRAQTGEWLNDQAPRKEEDKKADMEDGEQLRAVLYDKETKKDPISENGEVQSAMKGEEAHMSDGEQKPQVEAHRPDGLETTIHHTELNKGEETTIHHTELNKGEETTIHHTELNKGGETTIHHTELNKGGETTIHHTGLNKGEETTIHHTELNKGEETPIHHTELNKGDETTIHHTELNKGGETTIHHTELNKGEETTIHHTELNKGGETTIHHTELNKGEETTIHHTELNKGEETTIHHTEVNKGEETTIHHTEVNKGEEATFKPAETICPEQELWAKLQNQLAEHRNLEATCPTEEQPHMPTMEEAVTPAQETAAEIECWDENLIEDADEMQAGTCSPGLDLVSLLSEAQSPPDESRTQPSQAGWHIPAGPGLAELVHCPSWQFPTMSYYPSLQQTTPFEVVWRVWEEGNEGPIAAKPDSQTLFDFTVMSYNILAQDLLEANQELYTHCPLEVLEWTYRYYNLIEEILKWEPDILCLQEVQENHYREQLHPTLFEMGYTCVYKRRTRAKTDGCAICYRGNRFTQLSVSMLEFFRPETELLDRDNVGIVLLLQPIVTWGSEAMEKGPPLCVANTHLLFNPGRGDVKLAQLVIMLAEINHVVKSCRAKGEHCNVILCGDFNSVPNMPLYQFITTGQLYYHGLPAWMISGQEDMSYKAHHRRLFTPLWSSSLGITNTCQYTSDQETTETSERHIQESGKLQYNHSFLLQLRFCPAACVRPLDLDLIPGVTDITPDPSRENQAFDPRFRNTICHGLNLRSAYKHTLRGSERSEVTTLHSEAGATVDYIFYTPTCNSSSDGQRGDGRPTSGGLKMIGRLSLLSEEDLWAMKGLPNEIFPSDHLSLLARFQLELTPV